MNENPYAATPLVTTKGRRLSWRRIGVLVAIAVTVALVSSVLGLLAGWLTVLAMDPREHNISRPPHFRALFVTACGFLAMLLVSQASAIGLTMLFGRRGYSIHE